MESDTFNGDFIVNLIWRLSRDIIEGDTFYRYFMVKLM